MKVCIVSTEYAFEYPLGDFCYPFRLLAQELTKRNHEVTVLCLGPDVDIVHQGVRLRAVTLGAQQSGLAAFGSSLQVWQYLFLARETLVRELTKLSLEKAFDVVEASAQLLNKQLLDLPGKFVLRLNDADLPQGASTTERDLNLRLIRIKQSQAAIVADSIVIDRETVLDQNTNDGFAGDKMLEHLSFDIPSCAPTPLLPRNGSKSVFIAQWFKVAEARQQTAELLVHLTKNTGDFRFVIPCDCSFAEPNEQHAQDVALVRDKLSREIGSSEKLWIVHNLKLADLATCVAGCEATFVPSSAGIGFQFLGGFYVEACKTTPPPQPGEWVGSSSDKLHSLLAEQSVIDTQLSDEVRAKLADLVDSRIKSYQVPQTRSRQDLQNQFVDDADNLVLDMDRIASTLRLRPSLTDKIKNKVRRVLTSAARGAQ